MKFKDVNLYKTSDTLKPAKPYCGVNEIKAIKAIVLGTDPTAFVEYPTENNEKIQKLKESEYTFDINGDKRYFAGIRSNLNYLYYEKKEFSDSIENYLYVQNLCPNYLEHQTSDYYKKAWVSFMLDNGYVEKLKKDIDKFPDLPIFLTSSILLNVFCSEDIIKNPSYYYENKKFIEPEKNKLNRLLIPLFRHWKYALYHTENLAYTNAVRNRLNIYMH